MKSISPEYEFDTVYSTNPELRSRVHLLDAVVHITREVYDLLAATEQYIEDEYLGSGYINHARSWFSLQVNEGIYNNQRRANQLLTEIIGLQQQAGVPASGLPFHYHPYLEQADRRGKVPYPGQTLSDETHTGELLKVGLFDFSRQSFMSHALINGEPEPILLNHQLVAFL